MPRTTIPRELPVIEMPYKFMVFPGNSSLFIPFDEAGDKLYADISAGKHSYVLAVMSDNKIDDEPAKFFRIGVVCKTELVEEEEGIKEINLMGQYRALVIDYSMPDPESYWISQCVRYHDQPDDFFVLRNKEFVIKQEYRQVMRSLRLEFKNLLGELAPIIDSVPGQNSDESMGLYRLLEDVDDYDFYFRDSTDGLVWYIIHMLPEANLDEKQTILVSDFLMNRIELTLKLLSDLIEIFEGRRRIDAKIRGIPYEAGATSGSGVEVMQITDGKPQDDFIKNAHPELIERWKEYRKIENTVIPDVQKAFMSDFNRLKNCRPEQSEWQVFITHLDYLLKLHSIIVTPQETDIAHVEDKLRGRHYGLDKSNDRILDYIATKKRNPKAKAPILCFVGPPGVGKTSLGRAIADSLNLKFAHMSLGGAKDEAEIRGHRATYIGALPGIIVQELIRKGSRNLVFMLDEVDKIGSDFRGDPSSALLEVLDPEQNHSFVDHYIDAPFDLSGIIFLCTANLASRIQPALLNRMEVIDISGYTEAEKIKIAEKFLIPKQMAEEGLSGINIRYQDDNPDKVMSAIISRTREAGVRELERGIKTIFSKWGRQHIRGDESKRPTEIFITEELVEELLGLADYAHERVIETEIGEALGLTVDKLGSGAITYVQAQLYLKSGGEKSISQTDEAEKDLLMSNKRALTVVKNLLEKYRPEVMDKFKSHNLNLQVSDDARKVGGPSAGVPMAAAIYSELIQKPLQPWIAMTGLLTIKGRIRAVGGIKGKVLAAHRDGVKVIVLPKRNQRDVEKDIPEEIKRELVFHYVTRFEEVLPIIGLI